MVHEFNDEQLDFLHQINKARKAMMKAGADPSCVWMNRETYEFLTGKPPQIILDAYGRQIPNGQAYGLNIFVSDALAKDRMYVK
jgi:hypothetical protein